jgi:hypothetical protein
VNVGNKQAFMTTSSMRAAMLPHQCSTTSWLVSREQKGRTMAWVELVPQGTISQSALQWGVQTNLVPGDVLLPRPIFCRAIGGTESRKCAAENKKEG